MGVRRNNTFTRWIGDMVGDTKELVDDILDRAGDAERAVGSQGPISSELSTLAAAIEHLTERVNRLVEIQTAAAAAGGAGPPVGPASAGTASAPVAAAAEGTGAAAAAEGTGAASPTIADPAGPLPDTSPAAKPRSGGKGGASAASPPPGKATSRARSAASKSPATAGKPSAPVVKGSSAAARGTSQTAKPDSSKARSTASVTKKAPPSSRGGTPQ